MDTRIKIVSREQAAELAASGALTVRGFFDPLTAAHVARLSELKRPGRALLAVIADSGDVILPSRARAELLAGLAIVDYVAEAGAESDSPLRIDVNLEEEDTARMAALIEHVHQRQSAGVLQDSE